MNGIQNTSTNSFSTIIGNNKKFMVPKFQRDYSWTSEQWDDLWQDVETMINERMITIWVISSCRLMTTRII